MSDRTLRERLEQLNVMVWVNAYIVGTFALILIFSGQMAAHCQTINGQEWCQTIELSGGERFALIFLLASGIVWAVSFIAWQQVARRRRRALENMLP